MIDSTPFYRGTAAADSRSSMNVTIRLPAPELETRFVDEAKQAGLVGLRGHRSVGGVRASIYNACPAAAVDALVAFMAESSARAADRIRAMTPGQLTDSVPLLRADRDIRCEHQREERERAVYGPRS